MPGHHDLAARPDAPDAPGAPDAHELAGEVRAVVAALVRRHREDRTLPQPQVSAISWLFRKGPQTTSRLAALERVRPQSMAHTVAQLETTGLITRRPDERDGRQTLIELTPAGTAAYEAYRDAGESWIATAVRERLSPAERAELARGVALLGRLVDDDAQAA